MCVCVGGGQEMVCVCVCVLGVARRWGLLFSCKKGYYANNNRKVVSLCSCLVPIHIHDCHSKNRMSVLHMFHTNWISAILPRSENT